MQLAYFSAGMYRIKGADTTDYEATDSESVHRLVWENNWRFVQQHNSEGHSFEVEMNKFADLVSLGLITSAVKLNSLHACGPSPIAAMFSPMCTSMCTVVQNPVVGCIAKRLDYLHVYIAIATAATCIKVYI